MVNPIDRILSFWSFQNALGTKNKRTRTHTFFHEFFTARYPSETDFAWRMPYTKTFGILTETLRIEKSICVLTFGKNARVEVRVRGLLSLGAALPCAKLMGGEDITE